MTLAFKFRIVNFRVRSFLGLKENKKSVEERKGFRLSPFSKEKL